MRGKVISILITLLFFYIAYGYSAEEYFGKKALFVVYDYFKQDHANLQVYFDANFPRKLGKKLDEICNGKATDTNFFPEKKIIKMGKENVGNNELPFFCYNNSINEKIAGKLKGEKWKVTFLTDDYNYHIKSFKGRGPSFEGIRLGNGDIRYGIATASAILSETRRLFEEAYSGETIFIFFSGHGNYENNTFYFFPYDYHPKYNKMGIAEELIKIFQKDNIKPKLKYLKIFLSIDLCEIDIQKLEKYAHANDISLSILKATQNTNQNSDGLDFSEYETQIKGTLFSNAIFKVLSKIKNSNNISMAKELFGGEKDDGLLWNEFEKMKEKVLKAKKEFPEKYKYIKSENLQNKPDYYETKKMRFLYPHCKLISEINNIGGNVKINNIVHGILPRYYDCYTDEEKQTTIKFERDTSMKCIFCKNEVKKTRDELESDDGKFSFVNIKFHLEPLIPNHKFEAEVYLKTDKGKEKYFPGEPPLTNGKLFKWDRHEKSLDMIYKVEAADTIQQIYTLSINYDYAQTVEEEMPIADLLLSKFIKENNYGEKSLETSTTYIPPLRSDEPDSCLKKVKIKAELNSALIKIEQIKCQKEEEESEKAKQENYPIEKPIVNFKIFNEKGQILLSDDVGESKQGKEYKINIEKTEFIAIKAANHNDNNFEIEFSISPLSEKLPENDNKSQLFTLVESENDNWIDFATETKIKTETSTSSQPLKPTQASNTLGLPTAVCESPNICISPSLLCKKSQECMDLSIKKKLTNKNEKLRTDNLKISKKLEICKQNEKKCLEKPNACSENLNLCYSELDKNKKIVRQLKKEVNVCNKNLKVCEKDKKTCCEKLGTCENRGIFDCIKNALKNMF